MKTIDGTATITSFSGNELGSILDEALSEVRDIEAAMDKVNKKENLKQHLESNEVKFGIRDIYIWTKMSLKFKIIALSIIFIISASLKSMSVWLFLTVSVTIGLMVINYKKTSRNKLEREKNLRALDNEIPMLAKELSDTIDRRADKLLLIPEIYRYV